MDYEPSTAQGQMTHGDAQAIFSQPEPSPEALYEGLLDVADRLGAIYLKLARVVDKDWEIQQWRMQQQQNTQAMAPKREAIVFGKGKGTLYCCALLAVMFVAFYGFLSLFSSTSSPSDLAIWGLLAAAALVLIGILWKRQNTTALDVICVLALIQFGPMVVTWPLGSLLYGSSDAPNPFICILSLPLALGATVALVGAANSLVSRQNADNQQQNTALAQKNQQIEKQIQQCLYDRGVILSEAINQYNSLVYDTQSWYPPDYYRYDAAVSFLKYFRNDRVRTRQQMVNKYEEELNNKKILTSMENIHSTLQKILVETLEIGKRQGAILQTLQGLTCIEIINNLSRN